MTKKKNIMKEVSFLCKKDIVEKLQGMIDRRYPKVSLYIQKIEGIPISDDYVNITVRYSSPDILISLGRNIERID